jgi:uncharacterized protein (TIGR00725 family)
MKIATTFGASQVEDRELYLEGVELGRFLAEKGYLVKCGGYSGLMEAVSRGVSEVGGEIIGVTLKEFDEIREANRYLTRKIQTKDIFERLKILTQDSEIFIIQRGSIGTLNELFMVWTLKYGLKRDFRITLIGKNYQAIKNCPFIPKERLFEIEIYNNLNEFKESF